MTKQELAARNLFDRKYNIEKRIAMLKEKEEKPKLNLAALGLAISVLTGSVVSAASGEALTTQGYYETAQSQSYEDILNELYAMCDDVYVYLKRGVSWVVPENCDNRGGYHLEEVAGIELVEVEISDDGSYTIPDGYFEYIEYYPEASDGFLPTEVTEIIDVNNLNRYRVYGKRYVKPIKRDFEDVYIGDKLPIYLEERGLVKKGKYIPKETDRVVSMSDGGYLGKKTFEEAATLIYWDRLENPGRETVTAFEISSGDLWDSWNLFITTVDYEKDATLDEGPVFHLGD